MISVADFYIRGAFVGDARVLYCKYFVGSTVLLLFAAFADMIYRGAPRHRPRPRRIVIMSMWLRADWLLDPPGIKSGFRGSNKMLKIGPSTSVGAWWMYTD